MSYNYSYSRSMRASSALPDSLHRPRLLDNVDLSFSRRGRSVAREILDEEPSISSPQFKDILETREALDDVKRALRTGDSYWIERSNVLRSSPKSYVTVTGRGVPFSLNTPNRRMFPSSYWSYYPYSSTLPPFHSYGRPSYPLNDYLNDNYGHDPYYSHWYSHRGPFMRYPNTDWRSRSNTSTYRPRYTPTIRRYYY